MMNSFNEKPTSEQLVEKLDDALDITIGADVVHGLDYEYKQLQQENHELKNQLEEKENQQKEFLELLEGMYFETEDKWWLKILEKYKEIIGAEDENRF